MMSKNANNEKMRIADNPEYYQCFELHMKNGDVLEFAEAYDIPAEEGIIGDFKEGRQKFLSYGDSFFSYIFPFDQISYIVMTKVRRNPFFDV